MILYRRYIAYIKGERRIYVYNLKKIRLEKGLTQQKLCDKLREHGLYIDRTTYTKDETGARSLPCDILIALTKCFEKSADEILGIK